MRADAGVAACDHAAVIGHAAAGNNRFPTVATAL